MQERLESLAQHAQVLQDTVLKAEHINATLINSIGPGEKQELIRRLKTADYVSIFTSQNNSIGQHASSFTA